MKTIATIALITTILATNSANADRFTIGGFTFDEANTVRVAKVNEHGYLKTRSNWFAQNSRSNRGGTAVRADNFAEFDRSKTVGRILAHEGGGRETSDSSRHVLLPDIADAPPKPNAQRVALELSWDGGNLPNLSGNDFLIYEVGNWEGFVVSVFKSGSTNWSAPRYQFADSFDSTHDVNAVAFDLSNFDLKENDSITAIRISNLFNEKSPNGADRVDNEAGQGVVIYPIDPKYLESFKLRTKAGGKEFKTDFLDADIVYVVGLHNIQTGN